MLRVFSHSLGCPKNLVDTEHVLGAFDSIELVPDIMNAQCVFINTCAFITPAVQESVQTIIEHLADIDGEHVFVIVAGCLVGRYGIEELTKEIPEVNLWLSTDTVDTWDRLCADALQKHFGDSDLKFRTKSNRLLSTYPYAWLKIGEGCRHQCSFCTIPSIRGKYRSMGKDFLVQESRELLSQGIQELILVAQDVTAWGSDLGNKDLRFLLDDLLNLDGLARLRLMYLYPAGMTPTLLKYLSEAGDAFVPYFDIPLQHAHEEILVQMGRPFAQNPQIIIDRIRDYFPAAALRSTFIVGFPGETEEHFQTLARFIEKNHFQQMGVFSYAQEDGTKAALLPNQIDASVREFRRSELMQIQAVISEEKLSSYLGQRLLILIDDIHPEWPGLYIGRTWFQAPQVDGVTYVSSDPDEAPLQVGMLVEAEIVETKEYDLVALV